MRTVLDAEASVKPTRVGTVVERSDLQALFRTTSTRLLVFQIDDTPREAVVGIELLQRVVLCWPKIFMKKEGFVDATIHEPVNEHPDSHFTI